MVNLLQYLTRDRMAVFNAGSHAEILRKLVELCLRDDPPEQRSQMCDELLKSGGMKDQMLDQGFAITHGRMDDLPDIRASVGLLGPAARFARGAPLHTVFCAIIPAGKSSHYLSFMARLSRLLLLPEAAEVFRSQDPERILELIRRFES